MWLENNLVVQYWKNQRDPCSLSKHRWCALNGLWLVNIQYCVVSYDITLRCAKICLFLSVFFSPGKATYRTRTLSLFQRTINY